MERIRESSTCIRGKKLSLAEKVSMIESVYPYLWRLCADLRVKTKIHGPGTSTWDLSERLMAVKTIWCMGADITSDSNVVDVLGCA